MLRRSELDGQMLYILPDAVAGALDRQTASAAGICNACVQGMHACRDGTSSAAWTARMRRLGGYRPAHVLIRGLLAQVRAGRADAVHPAGDGALDRQTASAAELCMHACRGRDQQCRLGGAHAEGWEGVALLRF